MKKWISIFIAIVAISTTYADGPEKIEALSSKVILENTNGYFVLSDKSCWKAIPFSKRWRSLGEWWSGVQLAPENYDCLPNDWYLGAEIAVYAKYGNLDVEEANASNQEMLKQCTHLLVNTKTGQTLFAISLEPAECIIQLYKEASGEGYTKGFNEGRSVGYKAGEGDGHQAAFQKGFNEGRSKGYKSGYEDGCRSASRANPPVYTPVYPDNPPPYNPDYQGDAPPAYAPY